MFKFTIRELLLLMAIVAMEFGWGLQERQLHDKLLAASRVSEFFRTANRDLQIDFEVIQRCLFPRGLAIEWPNGSRPYVRKLDE